MNHACTPIRLLIVAVATWFATCPARAQVPPPDPQRLLLVADLDDPRAWAVEDHLWWLGAYEVDLVPPWELDEGVDLHLYDVVVLGAGAAAASDPALWAIWDSGRPLLILEGEGFGVSDRLGLVEPGAAVTLETEVIRSIPEGLTRYAWFAGVEVPVGWPVAPVHGVPEGALADGLLPVYYAAPDGDVVTVFVDPASRAAVVGLGETTEYHAQTWRVFDLLLDELQPVGPRWMEIDQVTDAFGLSGLFDLWEMVEEDPDGWPADLVVEETWRTMLGWNLFELAGHLDVKAEDLFGGVGVLPPSPFPPMPHPTHPVDGSKWFIGQDDDNQNVAAPFWGTVIGGTDLGIGVEHNGVTLVYMGDTSAARSKWGFWVDEQIGNCDLGVLGNDAIMVVSPWDHNPADGIDAAPFLQPYHRYPAGTYQQGKKITPNTSNRLGSGWTYYPISIPGIHTDDRDADYWYNTLGTPPLAFQLEPFFTGIAGATSITRDVFLPTRGGPHGSGIPTWTQMQAVILIYFASHENHASGPAGSKTNYPVRIYAALSLDGLTFRNLYQDPAETGPNVPFMKDIVGELERYMLTPVDVNAWDLGAICGAGQAQGTDPDSPLCDSALQTSIYTTSGTLLYGSSGRGTGLFIAYLNDDDVGSLVSGKPVLHYLKKNPSATLGVDWTTDPEKADYFIPDQDYWFVDKCNEWLKADIGFDCVGWAAACADWLINNPSPIPPGNVAYPQSCIDWALQENFKGPLPKDIPLGVSVKKVQEGPPGMPSQLVMMYTEPLDGGMTNWVRTAKLSRFWTWSAAEKAGVSGYGPGLFNEYTSYDSTGNGSLTVWHTASKWNFKFDGWTPVEWDGTNPVYMPWTTDYGVYTGSHEITPWPP